MKTLSVKKAENISGGGSGAMCFWTPFRAIVACGQTVTPGLCGVELGIINYCWNS